MISHVDIQYDISELIYKTNRLTDTENGFMVAKGEGWIGRSGLADANYYIQNGQTARSYCCTGNCIQ